MDEVGELTTHEYSVHALALHPEAQPPTTRTLILFEELLTAWKDGTTLDVVDHVTPLSVE
jgi:carbamoylphosphate synthase small subunit